MSARTAVVSVIGITILIIALSNTGDVDAPTSSPGDAATTEDAEEWVASVAENGFGHISTRTSSNEGMTFRRT